MAAASQTPLRSGEGAVEFLDGDGIENMYLTFVLGTEDYGVAISGVTEIVGMQRIMGVPGVPAHIVGVINLRGKVIPLMSLRRRFGMEDRAYDERTVIVVLDIANAPIGLIVDRVSEVLDIAPGQIDQAALMSSARSPVKALGRLEDRVVILLDADVLVADGDLVLPELAGV